MNSRQSKAWEKRKIKSEERAIRGILNDWDPIPGSPNNEYDCLVHSILSALHRHASKDELSLLIRDKLANHFGLHQSEEQIKTVSDRIWSYWDER